MGWKSTMQFTDTLGILDTGIAKKTMQSSWYHKASQRELPVITVGTWKLWHRPLIQGLWCLTQTPAVAETGCPWFSFQIQISTASVSLHHGSDTWMAYASYYAHIKYLQRNLKKWIYICLHFPIYSDNCTWAIKK